MTVSRQHLLELYPALAHVPADMAALRQPTLIKLKPGSTAFEEQQACTAFPFILSGRLRVVKRSENGREISLYNVTAGDACVVSAACLLGRKPYNAVAMVEEESELLAMPGAEFERLMAIPAFREAIFALFSKRVIDLMELVDEVAFRKLDQRLARLLIARGPEISLSHQALADELGTVREIVTRTLNGFADRKLVELSRGSIRLLNQAGLAEIIAG